MTVLKFKDGAVITANYWTEGDKFKAHGVYCSADGDAGEQKWRLRRIGTFADLLCARLSPSMFCLVHHVHDHEGALSVGVHCGRDTPDGERMAKAIEMAWEDLNEENVEIFFSPPWAE